MSVSGGNLYTSGDNAANIARQNIKGVHQMTGDEFDTYLQSSDSTKGVLVSVVLDSTDGPPASWKKGITYRVNDDDETTADPINDTVGHEHTGPGDGGDFIQVLIEGAKKTWFARPGSMSPEQFYKTNVNGTFTAKVATNDQYLEIDTLGTANNYGNVHLTNGFYSFGYEIRCSFEVKLTDTLTSYTARFGMSAEPAQATTDDLAKMLIEACPTCNGNNIRIISATGAAGSRSNNPKNATDVANVRDIFLLQLYPGVEVIYVSTSGMLQKTLDVPDITSGNSLPIRNVLAGIQTTTGSSRKMEIYQLEAIARKADTSFRDRP